MDSSIMDAKVLKHFTLQAFGFQQENTVVCSYYRAVRLFNYHYFKQWSNIFDKYSKIYSKYSHLRCWFVGIKTIWKNTIYWHSMDMAVWTFSRQQEVANMSQNNVFCTTNKTCFS